MTNIYRCRVCGRCAISEELSLHECRELLDVKFDGDITLIFDGEKWYPLKNCKPTDLLHGEKSTDYWKECGDFVPKMGIFLWVEG